MLLILSEASLCVWNIIIVIQIYQIYSTMEAKFNFNQNWLISYDAKNANRHCSVTAILRCNDMWYLKCVSTVFIFVGLSVYKREGERGQEAWWNRWRRFMQQPPSLYIYCAATDIHIHIWIYLHIYSCIYFYTYTTALLSILCCRCFCFYSYFVVPQHRIFIAKFELIFLHFCIHIKIYISAPASISILCSRYGHKDVNAAKTQSCEMSRILSEEIFQKRQKVDTLARLIDICFSLTSAATIWEQMQKMFGPQKASSWSLIILKWWSVLWPHVSISFTTILSVSLNKFDTFNGDSECKFLLKSLLQSIFQNNYNWTKELS